MGSTQQRPAQLDQGHWATTGLTCLCVCLCVCACPPPSLTFGPRPPQGRGGGRAPGEDAGAEQRKDGQEGGEVLAAVIVAWHNTTTQPRNVADSRNVSSLLLQFSFLFLCIFIFSIGSSPDVCTYWDSVSVRDHIDSDSLLRKLFLFSGF